MNADQISNAAHYLGRLKDRHDKFIRSIGESGASRIEGTSISVIDGTIVAAALGHDIKVAWRPIRRGDELVFNEYTFSVDWKGEPLHILTLNLERDESIYNPALDTGIKADCFTHVGNSYLSSHLMEAAAAALLDSVVFAPSPVLGQIVANDGAGSAG